MNRTPPTEDAAEFPGQRAAVCLGVALLVALFLVLFLNWRDNGQRAVLETTAELTAVGDSHYYPLPAQAPPPPFQAVASWRGQALSPTDYERYEFPPDDMARLGVDEIGGWIIYRGPPRAKDAADQASGPVYFLKVSEKEYLRITTGAK